MHSIRSKARRAAWSNVGDTPNYNPFARTRLYDRRTRSDDRPTANEEVSVGLRSRSETHLKPTIEEQRRLESTQAEMEFPAPHHADTAPPATTVSASIGYRLRNLPTVIEMPEVASSFRKPFKNSVQKDTEEAEHLDRVDTERSSRSARKRAMLHRRIPIAYQMRAVFLGSWINILLPVIPAGFTVYYTHRNPITVFCVNFVAIIPSSTLLSYSLDELGIRVGDKLEALLSMTFNNAVQLITSILLLKSRQVNVLRISLLGSILSNLLMMTGFSFLLGGLRRIEQYFSAAVAQTISMLLFLAVVSLVVPTASHIMTDTTSGGILAQSRGTSVVILVSYGLWLLFQIKTNRSMFREPVKPSQARTSVKVQEGHATRGLAQIGARAAASSGGDIHQEQLVRNLEEEEEEEEEEDLVEPQLSLPAAIATLIGSTALIAFNTSFATDSIQGVLHHAGLSQTFLGLVILPILSVDPTSIIVAMQDKMDMSIALTLERCMQTCLMVVPLVVLLAWCMRIDTMTLEFDGFSITTLFASIIIVTYVVQEGKSNWLTGALLIKVYIIIALAAFYIH